jgi:hypothetical protein
VVDLDPQLPFDPMPRLWQVANWNGHSRGVSADKFVGHCRHWGGLGSTSAMWRIADGGGIEQPDGSFLHQQIHTPDPFESLSEHWCRSAVSPI